MTPSAVRIARSSPCDSATVMPVGDCGRTGIAAVSTPAAASSASMNPPAASSPIAATSATRSPSRAAATAVIEADPPTTRAMLATSFSCWPKAGVTSSPRTSTSGLQSPITTRSNASSALTGARTVLPVPHQRDLHPGVGQRADRVRVGPGVGDELADLGHLADPGERDLADLGAVGHHHHPPGAADHDRVPVRLDLVVGGAAGLRVDAVDADEGDVEVEAGQARLGDAPGQLVGLAPGHPAGGDQLDPGPDGQLGR